MDAITHSLNFTRYVYSLHYACEYYNEFKLEHRTIKYSTIAPNRFDLALRIQLERYKGINSKSKGIKYYLSHFEGNRMKDLTGLRPTQLNNIFYGDLKYTDALGKVIKVLILVQILPENEELIADIFDWFYSKKIKFLFYPKGVKQKYFFFVVLVNKIK